MYTNDNEIKAFEGNLPITVITGFARYKMSTEEREKYVFPKRTRCLDVDEYVWYNGDGETQGGVSEWGDSKNITHGKKIPEGVTVAGDWKNPKDGDISITKSGDIVKRERGYNTYVMAPWTKFLSDISQSRKLLFLGASIGEGAGGMTDWNDQRKYSFRSYIRESLKRFFDTNNIGYVRGKGQAITTPWIGESWVYEYDRNAFGFGFMEASQSNRINRCSGTYRYVQLVYEGGSGSVNLRLVKAGNIIHTVDLSGGTGVQKSAVYDMGTLADQEFVIDTVDSTPTKIYGWYMWAEDPTVPETVNFTMESHTMGGAKNEDMSYEDIDVYLDSPTPVFDLIMNNDTDPNEVYAKKKYIAEKCLENDMTYVIMSTVHKSRSEGDSARLNDDMCRKVAEEYDNVIYMNYDEILRSDTDFTDSWGDLHPTKTGYRILGNYILGRMGVKCLDSSEMDNI